MLLTIDVGNSNAVFAIFNQEGEILGEWRISTDADRTADELGVWLIQAMAFKKLSAKIVQGAIIATVVPVALFNLRMLCRRYFDCEPMVANAPSVDLGIRIDIDYPQEVGIDRLVNAVAAHRLYPQTPLIVIDFGTATTFDVIGLNGDYQGGVICPGVNLSVNALHQAAAKLPHVAIGRPTRVIGKGTVEAMRSGIFLGYLSLIEGLLKRIQQEMEKEPKVIATGGLASLFASSTDMIAAIHPHLTLFGLFHVYQQNDEQ